MPSFLVLGLIIATMIGIVIVAIRLLLKKRSNELSERIATITPYKNIQESREKELKQSNESFFSCFTEKSRFRFVIHIAYALSE